MSSLAWVFDLALGLVLGCLLILSAPLWRKENEYE